jgi:hypothetical protein
MSSVLVSTKTKRSTSRSLYRQRQKILRDLTTALASASAKLAQSAAGESAFISPDDRKTAIDLLKILPHLLAILPDKKPDKPLKDDDLPFIWRDKPTHCPICCEINPQHWPENCKANPLNNPLCPICNERHHIFMCKEFTGTHEQMSEINLQQDKTFDRKLMRYTISTPKTLKCLEMS